MPIVNKIGEPTIKETFDSTVEAVFTLHLAKKTNNNLQFILTGPYLYYLFMGSGKGGDALFPSILHLKTFRGNLCGGFWPHFDLPRDLNVSVPLAAT